MSTTYNGWKNWETWNVHLWMFNIELNYKAIRAVKPLGGFDPDGAKNLVLSIYPNGTPDMDSSSDYVDVDWGEIAESFGES